MSPDCHPIFGRWTAADIEMKKKLFLGVIGGYYFQARIQELSLGQGGPTLINRQAKKKKKTTHTHKGRGRALQYLFCIALANLAIETAFRTKLFINMTSPVFSLHQNTFSLNCIYFIKWSIWYKTIHRKDWKTSSTAYVNSSPADD